MNIEDRVLDYSVAILYNDILKGESRHISLSLESGTVANIFFMDSLPTDWLVFSRLRTDLFMLADRFTDTYHLLQSEAPVFFTALDVDGLKVGSVHTDLNLLTRVMGEPVPSGNTLAALVHKARQHGINQKKK